MASYGKHEFWEDRYKKDPRPFDWFQSYAGLKPIMLEEGLEPDDEILMIGCGTSQMSEEMWDDGFKNITNIDYSATCIAIMEKRAVDKPGLTYRVMNMLDMKSMDQVFDFIIDKGTLDCILCVDNSFENVFIALKEVSRILKPGGVYMVVSYGAPDLRLNHLQKNELDWTVTIKTIEKPHIEASIPVEDNNVHYIYLCTKKGQSAAPPAAAEEKRESNAQEA